MEYFRDAMLVGIGATALLDLWPPARRKLFGTPPPNYAMLGRWLLHMPRGRFVHDSIAASEPVSGERLVGWLAHYIVGIAFAALLLLLWGPDWLDRPTLVPALIVGLGSVAAPFFLMQPAMGVGVAARRSPDPAAARAQSLVTHAIFGISLYLAASLLLLARGATSI